MAKEIQTTVTYVTDEDLRVEDQYSHISQITISSLKQKSVAKLSNVLIFKRGVDYKILKSRY